MPCNNQYCLLLWKNWVLQKRKIALTVFEILLPAFFALVLLALRFKITVNRITVPTIGTSWQVNDSFFQLRLRPPPPNLVWTLAYTPNNSAAIRLVNSAAGKLFMAHTPEHGYNDEASLVKSMDGPNNIIAGIVFDVASFPTPDTVSPSVSYKVRMRAEQYNGTAAQAMGGSGVKTSNNWFTDLILPKYSVVGPRQKDANFGGNVPGYFKEGFLTIQHAMDTSIIQNFNSSASRLPQINLKPFPYPPYVDDAFIFILQTQFPFIIMLSFIVIVPSICSEIVLEKEKKLKESMKLMGLKNWVNWFAWFTKFFVFMFISVVIMTILFSVNTPQGAIISYTNAGITFVFLLLYVISIIAFCFMISAFFKKASPAAAGGGIIFLGTYIPYFFLYFRYETMSFGMKFVTALINQLAMCYGCTIISKFEGIGTGVQWSTMRMTTNPGDTFSMSWVFFMLIFDTFLYLLITWYVEAIRPGEFGSPQPAYFPFTKWYWCGKSTVKDEDDFINSVDYGDNAEFFEPINDDAKVGIKIRGLSKKFPKAPKPSVNNLSLDLYEGAITALLGHNGAGKTTTMFMLTGFLPPSSGTAIINGYDIRTNMVNIRKNLGLCPQHNILFDFMTVEEHLKFFALLKGCHSSEVGDEVTKMIEVLHLENKRSALSKSLSGGMKRKLSVGIALIAGSKFVILDEPTSGMDPEARRQTWDILQSQQAGRTMILSTHFMDEADLLGDRIAIMAEGKIQCYGTSMFLKNKYGIGYHMTIVRNESCNPENITNLIMNSVPDALLESAAGSELSYILPKERSSMFEGLFKELEEGKEKLGIDSFGASVTTMEEVFIKVGNKAEEQSRSDKESDDIQGEENYAFTEADGLNVKISNGNGHYENVTIENDQKLKDIQKTGFSLSILQFHAMFYKRVIHSWRNRVLTIAQLLVPIIFTIIGCLIILTIPKLKDLPALNLNLSPFKKLTSYYGTSFDSNASAIEPSLVGCFVDGAKSTAGNLVDLNKASGGYNNISSLDKKLLSIATNSLYNYRNEYQLAADFYYDGSEMTTMYNDEAYHSIAMAFSYATNAILNCFVGETYSINTINHPLPWSLTSKLNKDLETSSFIGFIFSYTLMFGLAFLCATYIVFLITERVTGAKHSQYISGVNSLNFWASTLAWDYINFLFPTIAVVIVILIFQTDGYSSGYNVCFVLLDLLLYGWAILPATYLLSFLFNVASSGYVWTAILNVFTGTAAVLVIYILRMPTIGLLSLSNALEWIFYLLFPNFCFAKALQDMYANYQNKQICSTIDNLNISRTLFCSRVAATNQTNPCCLDNCGVMCATTSDQYLGWYYPGIGRSLFFMALQGIICCILLYIIESDVINWLENLLAGAGSKEEKRGSRIHSASTEDSDVKIEHKKVEALKEDQVDEYALLMKGLVRYYGDFCAVHGLYLGVNKGECFGLLGVNGAGKTSTFKMLTGDVTISSGEVYISGINVAKNIKIARTKFGYCPQFDALIDEMTVEENMMMHANLRGIPTSHAKPIIKNLIQKLMLQLHAKKLSTNLSGGNKRKLSICIALIGGADVIFMDEPTTGMDPNARRNLWDTLANLRNMGKTLILTSHSMEECEALCTRLAVMVNGTFKCLGSSQHLKSKYSSGYTLIVKIHPSKSPTEFEKFISDNIPDNKLQDAHEGLLQYHIGDKEVTWSQIFGLIEKNKDFYGIEDYSVGQTTLEQLFINFARSQIEEQERRSGWRRKFGRCCCCAKKADSSEA